MCWMRSSRPSRNADCVWETPRRSETPWTPIPAQPIRLNHTLRIIYHTLRLVSLLFLCIYWISRSAVLLLRPQISSPSLAFVSPPRPPTCIFFILFLSFFVSQTSFHCLNGPWLSSWELDFFRCQCLSCVLFFMFCVVCCVFFLSWTPSSPFSALNISVSVPYQFRRVCVALFKG